MQATLNSLLKHLVLETGLMVAALLASGTLLGIYAAPHQQPNALTAVLEGDNALLRQALRQGQNPNLTDDEGTPLLMNAVLYGDAQAVKMVLEAGANPNATNAAGATALIWAAADPEKATLLLDHGAMVNVQSALGRTPLLAAAGHDANVVAELLARGADRNAADNLKAPPHMFIGGGGAQPLIEAARARDGRALGILLTDGADPNVRDATGGTALTEAILLENVDNVRLLLDAGADVNVEVASGRYSPLMLAAFRSNPQLVRMLIEAGANVNAVDANGTSVLMWAAYASETGDTRVAEQLLAAGADSSVKNRKGESAITWAARQGVTPMVRLLKQTRVTE